MEDLYLSLEHFDGPLSLLLHLIEKHDIDLYDIEISVIADQFLAYLDVCKKNEMELASEFVVMAATLLEIKARMLLPNGDDAYKDVLVLSDDDPRFELMQRLIEYKKYKRASAKFFDLHLEYGGRRERERKYLPVKDKKHCLSDKRIEPEILAELFKDLLLRMPMEDETRAGFFDSITRDVVSVEEKTEEIISSLRQRKRIGFFSLLGNVRTKSELVVSFISVLNLVKDRLIDAVQGEQYGDILLEYIGGVVD